MTDHTPEPWETQEMPSEIECRKRGDWIMLSSPDWFRARACVNACAGISQADLELPATNERLRALVKACAGIPTAQLGDVKALVEGLEGMLHFFMGYSDMEAWKKADAALAPFREDKP